MPPRQLEKGLQPVPGARQRRAERQVRGVQESQERLSRVRGFQIDSETRRDCHNDSDCRRCRDWRVGAEEVDVLALHESAGGQAALDALVV